MAQDTTQTADRDQQSIVPSPQSPQAFYARFTKRPEIQRLLRAYD